MKISIIIPTYNRQLQVVESVKSVKRQTCKNIEILVCDDGSTDNTPIVIAQLQKKDKRIKFIPGKHTGLPAIARNKGIKRATGNLVAFLDSDDTWKEEKLERQVNLFNKIQGCDLIYTNAIVRKRVLIKKGFPTKGTYSNLLRSNFIVNSSVIVKKNILNKEGGFNTNIRYRGVEDYELWLRLSRFYQLCGINEPLVDYNREGERLSTDYAPVLRGMRRIYYDNIIKASFSDKLFLVKRIRKINGEIDKYK